MKKGIPLWVQCLFLLNSIHSIPFIFLFTIGTYCCMDGIFWADNMLQSEFYFTTLGCLILVGWIGIVVNAVYGYKKLNIVKNGVSTPAQLIKKVKTYRFVNKHRVYRLTFSYLDRRNKIHKITIENIDPYVFESKNGSGSFLIYHKNQPEKALLVYHLLWPLRNYLDKNFVSY